MPSTPVGGRGRPRSRGVTSLVTDSQVGVPSLRPTPVGITVSVKKTRSRSVGSRSSGVRTRTGLFPLLPFQLFPFDRQSTSTTVNSIRFPSSPLFSEDVPLSAGLLCCSCSFVSTLSPHHYFTLQPSAHTIPPPSCSFLQPASPSRFYVSREVQCGDVCRPVIGESVLGDNSLRLVLSYYSRPKCTVPHPTLTLPYTPLPSQLVGPSVLVHPLLNRYQILLLTPQDRNLTPLGLVPPFRSGRRTTGTAVEGCPGSHVPCHPWSQFASTTISD